MKKWITCCVLGLLLAGAAQAQNYSDLLYRDWAGLRAYAQVNRTLTERPEVVFMGNSITDGWWPKDSTFFIDNNFLDRGISGQTTSEMLVRFRQDVINLKPKAVVILAGINDIAHNNGVISLENVFGNIVSMAELARYNKITPIICSVLPAYDFPWRPGMNPAPKVIELNKMLKAYADKEGLTYVDYHSAMKDERDGLPKNLASDEVHPTLEGYKIMEKIVLEAIHKTIGE